MKFIGVEATVGGASLRFATSTDIILMSYIFNKHYANIPMHYAEILKGCKNANFQMKIFNIFLIFAKTS